MVIAGLGNKDYVRCAVEGDRALVSVMCIQTLCVCIHILCIHLILLSGTGKEPVKLSNSNN